MKLGLTMYDGEIGKGGVFQHRRENHAVRGGFSVEVERLESRGQMLRR